MWQYKDIAKIVIPCISLFQIMWVSCPLGDYIYSQIADLIWVIVFYLFIEIG